MLSRSPSFLLAISSGTRPWSSSWIRPMSSVETSWTPRWLIQSVLPSVEPTTAQGSAAPLVGSSSRTVANRVPAVMSMMLKA